MLRQSLWKKSANDLLVKNRRMPLCEPPSPGTSVETCGIGSRIFRVSYTDEASTHPGISTVCHVCFPSFLSPFNRLHSFRASRRWEAMNRGHACRSIAWHFFCLVGTPTSYIRSQIIFFRERERKHDGLPVSAQSYVLDMI